MCQDAHAICTCSHSFYQHAKQGYCIMDHCGCIKFDHDPKGINPIEVKQAMFADPEKDHNASKYSLFARTLKNMMDDPNILLPFDDRNAMIRVHGILERLRAKIHHCPTCGK